MAQEVHAENEACAGRTRVLLANEPRAYREVIAATVRGLRPEIEVLEAEPGSFAGSLASLAADMVVCTRATEEVRSVPIWVELYPDYGSLSVVSVSGRRREVEGIELSELLDLVDQADGIAQRS